MYYILGLIILAISKIISSHPTPIIDSRANNEDGLFKALEKKQTGPQNIISLTLNKVQTGIYVTTIQVGTPPQSILMAFDTGSSDTWVRLFNSTDCRLSEDQPCSMTEKLFLDSSESTSFKSLDSGFSMIYGVGEINGTWAKDTFKFDGTEITSFQFGAGDLSSGLAMNEGLVGLGLGKFESTNTFEYGIKHQTKNTYYDSGEKYVYENFPMRLKKDGIIKKNCYSVYYPDNGDTTCGIVFGGVDTAKYDSLITVPIIQSSTGDWSDYKEAYLLAVALEQIYVEYKDSKQPILGKQYPALIDTLTYVTVAPEPVVENLAKLLGGKYYEDLFGIVYTCNNNFKLSFSFGGDSIFASGTGLSQKSGISCIFPILKNNDDYIVLGGKFLTQFYTFFDLDDLQISFGKYKNTQGQSMHAINRNEKAPNTKNVKKYSSTFVYSSSDTSFLKYTSAIYKKGGHGSSSFFNNIWNSAMYNMSKAWTFLKSLFSNRFS